MLRGAAKTEVLSALRDTAHGDLDSAMERCRTICHLASAVREDPLLVTSLVSTSIEALSVDAIERILAMGSAMRTVSWRMQELLAYCEGHSALASGLRGERLIQLEWKDFLGQGSAAPAGRPSPWVFLPPRSSFLRVGGWT